MTFAFGLQVPLAPTVSPTQNLEPGINPYRHDLRAPTQFFDLDLDLNPDL